MEAVDEPMNLFVDFNGSMALRLWLFWVIATTVSSAAGWTVTNLLVVRDINAVGPEIALSDDNALAPLLLFGCGLLLLLTPIVGLAQGLVLRYTLKFRHWLLWIIATLLSVIVTLTFGVMLGVATSGSVADCIWTLVPGVIIGVSQWFVLENNMKIRLSGTWIVACTVGWIAGVGLAILAHSMLYAAKEGDYYNLPYYPAQAAVAWGVGWVLGSLVFSVITGTTLVWLLRTSAIRTVIS